MEKKILILTETSDNTADKVCQWLNYFNSPFIRFNTDIDSVWVDEVEIKGTQSFICIGHESGKYNLSDFSIIWFRRGQFVTQSTLVRNNVVPSDEIVNDQINNHIERELDMLNEFVYKYIPKVVKQINNPLKYNINKLECLIKAAHFGFNTPKTYITNRKDRVEKIRENTGVITKNIGDILICHSPQFFMSQGAWLVRDKDMNRADDFFSPSLFQNAIKKKADIRVFFMLDYLVAAAIYDYADPESIDFRGSRHRVMVPFDLDAIDRQNLLLLASEMGLESGSADLVLTEDNQLFFLEINPVGQLDFVSFLSNLHIEREIAKTLITHGKGNSKDVYQ